VFDVVANGATVPLRFDVAAGAHGKMTAYRKTVAVTDGVVVLELKPVQGEAIVSAIEVR
jgi:hypothetical protein